LDFGEYASIKPHIPISQELEQVQVLFSEVEHAGPLPRDKQHMNPDKVVKHPPGGGMLDTLAFLVRKRHPLGLEGSADAVFQGHIDQQTHGHHHQQRHDTLGL
jgi:hypothetical protein